MNIDKQNIGIVNGLGGHKLAYQAYTHDSQSKIGVVICHAHPLLGGSMFGHLEESLFQYFTSKCISVARFNYRGVFPSTGEYARMKGEVEDTIHFISHLLRNEWKSSVDSVIVAGYSFGAVVSGHVLCEMDAVCANVFISYPFPLFGQIDLPDGRESHLTNCKKPTLFIMGSRDILCLGPLLDKSDYEEGIGTLDRHTKVYLNSDHFFAGKTGDVCDEIWRFINENELVNSSKSCL